MNCCKCGLHIDKVQALFRTKPKGETPAEWTCEYCLTPEQRIEHQVDDDNQLFNIIRNGQKQRTHRKNLRGCLPFHCTQV